MSGVCRVCVVCVSFVCVRVCVCCMQGQTALILAAGRGDVEMVRLLAGEFNASINHCMWRHHPAPPPRPAGTALMSAVDRGHVEVVRLLVDEFNADVDAKCKILVNHRSTPGTALQWAAQKGHEEIVRILKAAPSRAPGAGNSPSRSGAEMEAQPAGVTSSSLAR